MPQTTTNYQLLDGKALADELKKEIAAEVEVFKQTGKKTPHLAAILVGNDPASDTYVNSKIRDCREVGFKSSHLKLPATISETELLQKIDAINHDPDVDGLIVQLPLPAHISVQKVTERISPTKDVDGFHPLNIGRMNKGLPAYIAATPLGIITLLKKYKIESFGKHCVVVGRSNIVGSPVSILMAGENDPGNCTVTLCHKYTQNLEIYTRQADILIVAVGLPGLIRADMVKEGVVVVDVGITRVEDKTKKSGYALVGDVDFEPVAQKASWITPVPRGVGPMTRYALLKNTLMAAKKEIEF